MKKINGVYAITHIKSGKLYIGSAINIEKRWSEHKAELKYNYHDNPRLQNAWNKYGSEAFEFKILEIVVDPSKLLIREQYWMDKLQSYDRKKGFNIRKKAESNFGLNHKLETIEKIRLGNIGKHPDQSGENNNFFGKKHTKESLIKMRTPRSEEVRQKFKEAAKKRWENNHIEKVCKNCQIAFDTILSANNDFCSRSCSSKYYGRLRTQEGTLKKNCLICNTEFVTNKFQDKKYCSRACWSVSLKNNKFAVGHK